MTEYLNIAGNTIAYDLAGWEDARRRLLGQSLCYGEAVESFQ